MTFALMSSGGKDSTLALDRARRDGLDVRYLVNIYDGVSERVAFHGVRKDLVATQAAVCRLQCHFTATDSENPYEEIFCRTLDTLAASGVRGIVFGNIHLADVRAWFEERVRRAGLKHVEPLWGEDPTVLLNEFVLRGFKAIVASVDLEQADETLLGRGIDDSFIALMNGSKGIDPCGERGEYHTFVYDGPTFSHRILFTRGEERRDRGHALLDLVPDGP